MPIVRIYNKTSSEVAIAGLGGVVIPPRRDISHECYNDELDRALAELNYLQDDVSKIVYAVTRTNNDYGGGGGGVIYMTTAERLADAGNNSLVYDTDLQILFVWNPVSSSWELAGGVNVRNEGTDIGFAKYLDYVGSAHNAFYVGNNIVEISAPPVIHNPFFNEGNATVLDVGVAKRIASPAPDFSYTITGWTAGQEYTAYSGTNPIWDTVNVCSIYDASNTVLSATIFAADGTTVIGNRALTVTGPINDVVNNIRFRITDWASAAGSKFEGRIRVSPDMSAILPGGGKYTIVITHDDYVDGTYTKTETLFYDICPQPATVSGVSVSNNVSVLKYLSGLPYYDLGSSFDISILNMNYLNADTYPTIQCVYDATDYGIGVTPVGGSFSLSGSDLTGWSTQHLVTGVTYSATGVNAKVINMTNYRSITSGASVSAAVYDWASPQDSDSSALSNILIDTWTQQSDELSEYFTDEVWRRTETYAAWNSTQDLGSYTTNSHLLIQNGELQYPYGDWSTYSPTNTVLGYNPNYSAGTGWKYYYRELQDTTFTVRTNFTLTISGFTAADLIAATDIRIWFDNPSKYTSPCYIHGASLYNAGTFSANNDPIRTGHSGNQVFVTFGAIGGSSKGLDTVNNTFYMHVAIAQGSSIKPDAITVSW